MNTPEYLLHRIDGHPFITPVSAIPDAAPERVREGLARRRLALTTGTCPCGATMPKPNRAQRRAMDRDRAKGRATVWEVDIHHEAHCPAVDSTLGRWGA